MRSDMELRQDDVKRIRTVVSRPEFKSDPLTIPMYLAAEAQLPGEGGIEAVAKASGVGQTVIRLGLAEIERRDAFDSEPTSDKR